MEIALRTPSGSELRIRGIMDSLMVSTIIVCSSSSRRNGDVFIVINKSRNRVKLLHMEPGGLDIYSKLLEEGRFRLPSRDQGQGSVKMNWLDLVMIVEGVGHFLVPMRIIQ